MANDRSNQGGPRQRGAGAGPTLSRRAFIQLTGLGTTVSAIGCGPSGGGRSGAGDAPFVFDASVTRPDDFVSLRFDFYGLTLNAAGDKLVPEGDGRRLIVVGHGSQHLIEQAFDEGNPPASIDRPVAARLANGSRVVFEVPADVTELPYDLTSLLEAIRHYRLGVAENALPPSEEEQAALRYDVASNLIVAQPVMTGGQIGGPVGERAADPGQAMLSPVQRQRIDRGQVRQSRTIDTGVYATESDARVTDVIAAALGPGAPEEPTERETAIELPFRLILSPHELGGFEHAAEPVVANGRTELWHSRLGTLVEPDEAMPYVDERNASLRTARAIWTRDYLVPLDDNGEYQASAYAPEVPFPVSSLRRNDRTTIVRQTSDYSSGREPRSIEIRRLMLTGLGGWLDSLGEWPGEVPLAAWEHQATLGRDQYVRVEYRGYLYPFGHRAKRITITERKFLQNGPSDSKTTAYLWQRTFIEYSQLQRVYGDPLTTDRRLPFTDITLLEKRSPNLSNFEPDAAQAPLRLEVDGAIYLIPMEALDREGRIHRFRAGAVFVPIKEGGELLTSGADGEYTPASQVDMEGQRIALALANKPDDTTYEVDSLTFENAGTDQDYLPGLKSVDLLVEAARALGSGGATAFRYYAPYVNDGFTGANANGQVVLEAEAAVDMTFSDDSSKSGGFITPNMSIRGLSRTTGPVGGDLAVLESPDADQAFDPAEFFGGLPDEFSPRLFGTIKLFDLIPKKALKDAPNFVTQALDAVEGLVEEVTRLSALLNDPPFSLGTITALDDLAQPLSLPPAELPGKLLALSTTTLPQLRTDVLNAPGGLGAKQVALQAIDRLDGITSASGELEAALIAYQKGVELAKDLTVRLDWRVELDGLLDGLFEPRPGGAFLVLAVEARGKAQPGKPAGVDLVASVENFNINLLTLSARMLKIPFERVQFRVGSGKKPEIDVVFQDTFFDGVLAFVQKLAEIIPADGFSDPPAVEVTAEGITAGFSIGLPSLSVGVLSIDNLSLGAGFNIPFIGPPITVNFNFCTRESPFTLTVMMFGGGGFFGIGVSPQGVELLEAALEFGAAISIDFGVASGGVSVMAGIYFQMTPSTAELTGYLRFRGEVQVLGLISAAIELYMELKYEFATKKVIGKASIIVEVSVFCFSGKVEITAERKFAGSNDDPTLADVMDEPDWTEYLAAFAA